MRVLNGTRAGRVIRGRFLGVRRRKGSEEGAALMVCAGEKVLVSLRQDYDLVKMRLEMLPAAGECELELTGEGGDFSFRATRPIRPPSRGAQPAAEEQPSTCTTTDWLYARSGSRPNAPQNRVGKFLVFAAPASIDGLWAKIRGAVVGGKLGPAAKVSTQLHIKLRGDRDHVICVYTADSEDTADRDRVRSGLRDLGFERALPYKTDEETLAGLYAGRGLPRLPRS